MDTPVTSETVIPEPTIELMSTTIHGINDESGESVYLLPSPEIYMKRLLAAGSGNIFQLARCFRDSESPSSLHSHEFLMLEWYTINADYIDSLETTEELLKKLARECDISPSAKTALSTPSLRMTIEDAFKEFSGIDLSACRETGALREAAERRGLGPDSTLEWADLFHLILVGAVEPKLPRDRPVALIDYPARVECLAKVKKGTPWRERWELYLRGVETADCFTEMTSPAEVRAYFAQGGGGRRGSPPGARSDGRSDSRRGSPPGGRSDGRNAAAPADTSFPDIYDGTHPNCSGVAMGVDRLLMVLAGAGSVSEIMPFPRGERF